MADMGIKDYIVGRDLLGEHNMKPWWESFHGYFSGASLAIGLLLTYLVSPTDVVNCLPAKPATDAEAFSEPQAFLTNGFCVTQVPWYASNSGLICTGVATVILVISNLWLSHPDVINGFRIFAKAEDIILNLKSPTEKLKLLAISPLFDDDEESCHLRKMCIFLWTYGTRVYQVYQIRNAFVILLTLLATCLCSYMSYLSFSFSIDPFITCNLSDNVGDIESLDGNREFLCSYNISKRIFPFMVLFVLTLCGQLFSLCCGVYEMYQSRPRRDQCQVLSDEFRIAKESASFMTTFWTNSHPIDSDAFADLVTFVFSSEALNGMVTFIEDAVTNTAIQRHEYSPKRSYDSLCHQPRNPDLEYVRLFSTMHYNGGNIILSVLFKIFCARKKDDNFDDICNALSQFKFKNWDKEANEFLRITTERRLWPLAVKILNAAQSEPDMTSNCISLDQLEYSNESRNSILYYALRKDRVFQNHSLNAAKYALTCTRQETSVKYVHYDGKSVFAEEFIEQQRKENPTFSESLQHEFLRLLNETQVSFNKEGSQNLLRSEFRRLYHTYSKVADDEETEFDGNDPIKGSCPRPENSQILEEIADEISRLKFHDWDEQIKDFTRLASEKRHWNILVALLDAKIVRYTNLVPLRQPEIENCGVGYLPFDSPMEHNDSYGRSVLYYIFSKPGRCFQKSFTAFRHVLSCNWGKKQLVRELRRTRTLREYILNSEAQNIPDKDELIRWVEESEMSASAEEEVPDGCIQWPKSVHIVKSDLCYE